MEVHQQPLPGGSGAFADLHGSVDIAVAAAETATLVVIRVVPDPDADGIDAVVRQKPEQIRLPACKIAVFYAAGLLRQHAGDVHAEKEIFRQAVHFLYIEGRDFLLRF